MGEKLTPRARDLVAANKSSPVVSGQWLDKDRRRVSGPPETWVKLRYKLSNMRQFTLNEADRASLAAIGFEPRWRGIAQPPSGSSEGLRNG